MKPYTLITYPGLVHPTRRFVGWLLSIKGLCAVVQPLKSKHELIWVDVRTLQEYKEQADVTWL